ITFKSFTDNTESLVTSLEKSSIALIIKRYVALIQTVPVLFSNTEYAFTSADLSYSSPLLFFSASVVQSSYCSDNEGEKESFILTRRLYNSITNNKYVPSNVIIFYTNKNRELIFPYPIFDNATPIKHHSKPNNSNPIPKTTNQNNSSNANSSSISSLDTRNIIDNSVNSSESIANT
ncbi:8313_t:CDS:2, partial [Gigaspora margarita]